MGNDPQAPVVFVTGTSSGIGLALAHLLSQSHYRVVLTARESSLETLSKDNLIENERVLIRPLDVNDAQQRQHVVQEVRSLWGGVDILVNNAGISYRSVVEHMTDSDELIQLQTNFLAPMALTRLVLPDMRKKRFGRIINISSVGGMMAMPTMGSYSAAKFALEGASEALWYELRPWNVFVSLVQPGFVRSNSFRNVYWSKKAKLSADGLDDYSLYYHQMGSFIERLMENSRSTAQDIARIILKTAGKKHPPLRVPATLDAHFFSTLRRLLPRAMYHKVLYWGLPGVRSWGKQK